MDNDMSYGRDYSFLPVTSVADGVTIRLQEDLFSYTNKIVNIVFIGHPTEREFVLVDAGLTGSSRAIIEAAETIYGEGAKAKAIVLTHGHFDHVGSIIELIEQWEAPVYAHTLEIPFLTGEKNYPPADSSVEGGLIAKLSSFFPNQAIDLSTHVQPLNVDGTIPHLNDFQWIHSPGHSPGHVSLFRERDRSLIVGDAFITVRQDSLIKTLIQKEEITGPPRYFTTNWDEALESIKLLQQLMPALAITGHGVPVSGKELEVNLRNLVTNFEEIYKPDHGKYVDE